MAGPTTKIRMKFVTARPVSQPNDVVPSKRRYRWTLTAKDAPGRYEMVLWGSRAKGQNDRFNMNPKKYPVTAP